MGRAGRSPMQTPMQHAAMVHWACAVQPPHCFPTHGRLRMCPAGPSGPQIPDKTVANSSSTKAAWRVWWALQVGGEMTGGSGGRPQRICWGSQSR